MDSSHTFAVEPPPPEIYDFIDDGCCILIAAITQNQLKPASFGGVCKCWWNTPLILTLPATIAVYKSTKDDPFLLGGFRPILGVFFGVRFRVLGYPLMNWTASSIFKVFTSNCLANKLECRATQFPIALVTKTLRLCSLRWKRPQKKGVVAPHAINFYAIFNLIQVCCTKWLLQLLSDCSCDCFIFAVVSWVFNETGLASSSGRPKDFPEKLWAKITTSHLSCVKRLGLRNNRRVSGAESCS